MAKAPGYHFRSGPEGMLAIEADVPYPGAVTLSWRPTAASEQKATAIMPQSIFAACALEYVKELSAATNVKKAS